MSGLHVDSGGMNNNGRTTVANAGYLQNELASLSHNMDGLMSIWKGLSANEFNQSYQQQAKTFNDFRQLLDELGEKISTASQILNRTEEENASAGSRLFG